MPQPVFELTKSSNPATERLPLYDSPFPIENSRLPYQLMVGKPARTHGAELRSERWHRPGQYVTRTGHAVAPCQVLLLCCIHDGGQKVVLVREVAAEVLKVRVQRLAVPTPRREEDDERVLATDLLLKVGGGQGRDAAALLLSGRRRAGAPAAGSSAANRGYGDGQEQ